MVPSGFVQTVIINLIKSLMSEDILNQNTFHIRATHVTFVKRFVPLKRL